MTADELPTQDDFDPWHGSPDASWAHGLFGGLTIPEAINRFQEAPDSYWEAFMCMGGKAFAYYFPVIEHHFHTASNLDSSHDDWVDPKAWIIAKSIENQFDHQEHHNIIHLAPRVIELADFVQDNIRRFDSPLYGDVTPDSVSDAWAALKKTVQSLTDPQPPSTQN